VSDTPKTTRVLPEVTWSVVVNDEWMCLVRAETSDRAIVMAGDVWRGAFPDDREGIRLMSVHRGDMRGKLRTVSDAVRGGFMLAPRPRGRSDAERGGFITATASRRADAERGGLMPATEPPLRPDPDAERGGFVSATDVDASQAATTTTSDHAERGGFVPATDELRRPATVGSVASDPGGDPPVLDYILRVLTVYERAESSNLMWRVEGDTVRFSANCSDTFGWALADAENIEVDDLELLERTLDDLQAADHYGDCWISELFATRKRGERPMNRYMETITAPALRALFEQAGPERPSTFLAP
jgi:hypothetical protein